MKKVLDFENLSAEFKTQENEFHTVLKELDFDMNAGETLGVVGESGSGKTVTSLCLMGLLPKKIARIKNGQILFYINDKESIDLLKLRPKEHRKLLGDKLSMIFQDPMTSLNPVKRSGNQLIESLRLHQNISKKKAKIRAIELLKEMELPEPKRIYKAYPHELSGGQKQRVMIAMALSCNPKILIADEPTTALDVTVQKSVLDLLKKLQKKFKMSVLFITHDLGVIAQIADRVMVMYQGEIVEKGSVKEIFQNAQHPYTKGLIACRPRMDKRLRQLPTVNDFLNYDATNIVFKKENEVSLAERKNSHEKIYASKPIMEVKNLTKTYYSKEHFYSKKKASVAVENVSFFLYPGETLGLVGESGCGKTTLSRCLLRLIDMDSGSVIYKNTELSQLSPRQMRPFRKRLQIVFQDPYSSLNERMKIGDIIREPLQVHEKQTTRKQQIVRTQEVMEKVGLPEDYYYRYPHELSGGQRQRVCIARAIIMNPDVLICDESVSALDVSVQAQVLNLLNKLKREFNLSFLFISHDLSVVKFMSDRIMLMHKGKMVEEGNPDEIYKNPKEEYTKRLIQAIPKV
jgi:peptide/nickel transport system ATP-binding protein